MSYRDDIYALETRCEVLDRDLVPLREERRRLDARAEELAQEIAKRKWRIRIRRALQWMRRHYLFTGIVLLATGVPSCLAIKDAVESFWTRLHQNRLLDRLGCHGVLEVSSQPSGAAVLAGTRRLGQTPYRERLCPSRYLIRVVHRRALPWQRAVELPASGTLSVRASLIPWRPSERPPGGSVIYSSPDGALVFVDGRELGRTPVFVPDATKGSRLVALAAPDYLPTVLHPRPNSALWFTLSPIPKRPDDARR